MLQDGRADIGIATESLAGVTDFVSFPTTAGTTR
jgi:hypothetical protein